MTTTPHNHGTTSMGQRPTLGRYVLVREIARSNDVVWEATDPKMNRRVAVKELNLTPGVTGQARRDRIERFYREARAAGAMSHPNIVTIHEVGEDNGRYFIAMEYLEGQTLRERLSVAGALPLVEVVSLGTQLCDALEYAHQRGVIHRDIKPDNVHLVPSSTSEPGGRVKLTDFGIARITHETQLTVAGQVFGTPSYMSPEQVIGTEIDARSDIFSMGILLYEMVTGRKPFTGDSVVTITHRIINEPTPPAFGAPPVLENVLNRALAKAPAQRYQSVAELRAALLAAGSVGVHPSQQVSGVYPAYQTGYPAGRTAGQQATAMYGAQTQLGVAPVSPVAPPAYTPTTYPTGYGGEDQRRRPFTPVAVTILLITTIATGGGWALSTAYRNSRLQSVYGANKADYNRAVGLYQSKDYVGAATLFRKLRESGKNGEVASKSTQGELYCYRELGHAAQTGNDLPGAEKWYRAAIAIAPGDAQAQEELAAILKQQGKSDTFASNTTGTEVSPPGSAVAAAPRTDGRTPYPGPALPSPIANPLTGILPDPSPSGPPLTANDFTSANSTAARAAQSYYQKGEEAFSHGDQQTAMRWWMAAVSAGPGSPAAQQAQQRITRYHEDHDLLEGF